MITLTQVIKYVRDDWGYMIAGNRDESRIKSTSEVFTPNPLVHHMLDTFVEPESIKDNFLDPSCGDGQILSEILIRKLELLGKEEITYEEFGKALSTIYGVDLMIDNVDLCRKRLSCGIKEKNIVSIVEKNIVRHDALTYEYKFPAMNAKRRLEEQKLRESETLKSIFENPDFGIKEG